MGVAEQIEQAIQAGAHVVTCGICNPEGFRDAWASSHWIDAKSTRVWGYAVSADPMALAAQTRHLIYHGAEHVFADVPSGQVRHRPGFKMMSQPIYLREGDTLLLAYKHALGSKSKQARRIEEELEARGVAVWELAGGMRWTNWIAHKPTSGG